MNQDEHEDIYDIYDKPDRRESHDDINLDSTLANTTESNIADD